MSMSSLYKLLFNMKILRLEVSQRTWNPASIYLLKVNNRNTFKGNSKTPERRQVSYFLK